MLFISNLLWKWKRQAGALPYFSEGEWLRARALIADEKFLRGSQKEFVALLEHTEQLGQVLGEPLVRVNIEVDALVAWARANGREVDAKSCGEFAAYLAVNAERRGKKSGVNPLQ